jgi:hypothetical protein
MAETPDEGREFAEFTLKDRKIKLYRPSTGQMLVVLTIMDLQDEEEVQEQVEMVLNFGTVIRKLFVDPDDRRWVLRGLADDKIDLEDYFALSRELVEHWAPEQANNRAERRAPAKKAAPAKRVSVRARR